MRLYLLVLAFGLLCSSNLLARSLLYPHFKLFQGQSWISDKRAYMTLVSHVGSDGKHLIYMGVSDVKDRIDFKLYELANDGYAYPEEDMDEKVKIEFEDETVKVIGSDWKITSASVTDLSKSSNISQFMMIGALALSLNEEVLVVSFSSHED